MENELMYGNRTICTFQTDPGSVVPIGTRSTPSLRLWAMPAKTHPIEVMGSSGPEKRSYSVISHDLGLYLGKGHRQGGAFLSSVMCSGLPLRSWWETFGTLEFLAPLDYFKLEEIERERKKDVVLVVSGTVVLAIHPKAVFSKENHLEQIDGFAAAELELTFRIAQSHWVDNVLSRLGHRKFHLLELDLTHCEITKALEYIADAESAVAEGRLVDAAIKCRDMVDYMTLQYLAFPKGDQRRVKWSRAKDYFKEFASLAGHQEEKKASIAADFAFDKEDAEFTLILAKALVRYAQVLKKNGSI
jgi:hypothetical protein